ncbi:MAG: fluoride efflux transporter CrcB [Actinomycetota bacterium]|nr:fluoride efflux transporter CrcB [Actinomycetota bacterium]
MNLLLVVLGGGLGAGGRYLLGGWLHGQLGSGFPWGTFAVNALGSLMIGLVFGLAQAKSISPGTTLFLAVGVLGGFTTFSAFSYETMRLLANGSIGASFLNVAGQFAVGLVAVYAGFVAVRGLAGA